MASALLLHPKARKSLFGGCGFVPGLEDMKRWLELAWRRGFDPVSCAQLFPVVGTDKWVGTSECWTLLSSFGIKCRIVSFVSRDRARKSSNQITKKRPRSSSSTKVAEAVRGWLLDYFKADSGKDATSAKKRKTPWDKPSTESLPYSSRSAARWPLYMQHNGHSRVCVGVSVRGEKDTSNVQLLIFDPATYGPDLKSCILNSKKGWHSMIKRGLHTLRKPEYQFVVPDPDASYIAGSGEVSSYLPVEQVIYA